ncbi:hypothetical protein D9M70_582200 [compost metagenome]
MLLYGTGGQADLAAHRAAACRQGGLGVMPLYGIGQGHGVGVRPIGLGRGDQVTDRGARKAACLGLAQPVGRFDKGFMHGATPLRR